MPTGFAASLGCGHVAPGELVRASFEFLLEREPATSILREFSLDVISQYFPSYPAEICARLGGSDPGTPPVDDPPDLAQLVLVSLRGRRAGVKIGAGCPPTPVSPWDVSPPISLALGP